MNWFVLSVKKNCENKVEETLNKIGLEVFNPKVEGIKYWGNRSKTVRTPLFKSFIFVRIEERYKRVIFGISEVKGYLFLQGKPALLPEEEVQAIRKLLNEDNFGLLMLSKYIENNQINIESLFSGSSSGVKWISKSYTSQLMDKMKIMLERNTLRDVV